MPHDVMIQRDGSRLVIRAPYALKNVCKSLPGRKWSPGRRAWTVPATPFGALGTMTILNARDDVHITAVPEEVIDLMNVAGAVESARTYPAPALPVLPSKTEPWEHQKRGCKMIADAPAVLLAWDMGTGKTKPVIDYICSAKPHRVLIMCPKSVIPVWSREFIKHAANPAIVIPLGNGTVTQRKKSLDQLWNHYPGAAQPLVAVLNYEAAIAGAMARYLASMQIDLLVCDECHKLKAPRGRTSMLAARMRTNCAKRVGLSGTPMPHSPLDLWAVIRWLDPGLFEGTFTVFRSHYAETIPLGSTGINKVVGFQCLDELNQRFEQIAYRVRKEDVLELPDVMHEVIDVQLDDASRTAYRQMAQEFVADVEGGIITATNALARLMRLQQITSGFARIEDQEGNVSTQTLADPPAKAVALRELLEDLPPDEPIVVFCRFHHDLDAVHAAAKAVDRCSCELSGRRHDIQGYWEDDGTTVAAVQTQAGSLGIDLTRARYCVFYSMSFSLGDYRQAVDRLHRPGQTQKVTYYYLLAPGTVDHHVMRAMRNREDAIQCVLNEIKKGSFLS